MYKYKSYTEVREEELEGEDKGKTSREGGGEDEEGRGRGGEERGGEIPLKPE